MSQSTDHDEIVERLIDYDAVLRESEQLKRIEKLAEKVLKEQNSAQQDLELVPQPTQSGSAAPEWLQENGRRELADERILQQAITASALSVLTTASNAGKILLEPAPAVIAILADSSRPSWLVRTSDGLLRIVIDDGKCPWYRDMAFQGTWAILDSIQALAEALQTKSLHRVQARHVGSNSATSTELCKAENGQLVSKAGRLTHMIFENEGRTMSTIARDSYHSFACLSTGIQTVLTEDLKIERNRMVVNCFDSRTSSIDRPDQIGHKSSSLEWAELICNARSDVVLGFAVVTSNVEDSQPFAIVDLYYDARSIPALVKSLRAKGFQLGYIKAKPDQAQQAAALELAKKSCATTRDLLEGKGHYDIKQSIPAKWAKQELTTETEADGWQERAPSKEPVYRRLLAKVIDEVSRMPIDSAALATASFAGAPVTAAAAICSSKDEIDRFLEKIGLSKHSNAKPAFGSLHGLEVAAQVHRNALTHLIMMASQAGVVQGIAPWSSVWAVLVVGKGTNAPYLVCESVLVPPTAVYRRTIFFNGLFPIIRFGCVLDKAAQYLVKLAGVNAVVRSRTVLALVRHRKFVTDFHDRGAVLACYDSASTSVYSLVLATPSFALLGIPERLQLYLGQVQSAAFKDAAPTSLRLGLDANGSAFASPLDGSSSCAVKFRGGAFRVLKAVALYIRNLFATDAAEVERESLRAQLAYAVLRWRKAGERIKTRNQAMSDFRAQLLVEQQEEPSRVAFAITTRPADVGAKSRDAFHLAQDGAHGFAATQAKGHVLSPFEVEELPQDIQERRGECFYGRLTRVVGTGVSWIATIDIDQEEVEIEDPTMFIPADLAEEVRKRVAARDVPSE